MKFDCKPIAKQLIWFISSYVYLIRYRGESEVFQVRPILKGDASLEGANIPRESRLQDPGNRHLSEMTPVPHDRIHS